MFSYLIYILTGAVAGMLSGLLGLAGGIIIVPILTYTFAHFQMVTGIEMNVASGTALAAISVTAISSTISHQRRHNIQWQVFWQLLPGIIIGTISGGLLAPLFSTQFLIYFFASFLFLVALHMLFFPQPNPRWHLPAVPILFLIGLAIGILSGLLGIGGGIVIAPLLIIFNRPTKIAAGTSAACGLPIAIIGTGIYFFTGYMTGGCVSLSHCGFIYWPAALIIATTSVLFVPVGAYFSQHLPVATIKKLFILVMLATAIKMFWI